MSRQYAETVRAILDPSREFFGDRVVANAGHTTSARLVVQDLMKKLDAQVCLPGRLAGRPAADISCCPAENCFAEYLACVPPCNSISLAMHHSEHGTRLLAGLAEAHFSILTPSAVAQAEEPGCWSGLITKRAMVAEAHRSVQYLKLPSRRWETLDS